MINWLRLHWPKVVSSAAILAVAAVAGVISYSHMYELSLALHQGAMAARLMPFGVDGLIVVGSVVLLQTAPGQRWLGWVGVLPGLAISLFANIESGLRYGPLAAIWAGVPALSFFIATFILERWLQGQAKAKPESVSAPIVMDASESVTAVTPESSPVRAVKSTPRQPKAATPESAYAALLARGELPSIRAIRRDMHVGDVKAKAIHAQLAAAMDAAA